MQRNARKFSLNKQREIAAKLLAEDELTDEVIAKQLGVDPATLWRWKQRPEFQERFEANREAIRQAVLSKGIADRVKRISRLNDRWNRMHRVIEARSQEHVGIPGGGETGLLVRQVKGIGGGENYAEVEEYAVDTGLLREIREAEKQAAQELGQWTEKREITGQVEVKGYTGIDPEQV